MIAFKDKKDGYYQFDWDGASPLPEWTNNMTQIDVMPPPALTQAQIDQQASDKAKADLIALDLASIRAIREYIVSKVDAPQILKDKDALAAAARTKVKP